MKSAERAIARDEMKQLTKDEKVAFGIYCKEDLFENHQK
jgi:hypothetical protein